MSDRSRSPSKRRAISDHGQTDAPDGFDLVAQLAANTETTRSQRANSDHVIYHQMAVENVPLRNADRTATPAPIVTDHEHGEIRNQALQLSEGHKMVTHQLGVMFSQQHDTASAAQSVIIELQLALAEMRERQNCMRQDNVLLRNSMMEQGEQ